MILIRFMVLVGALLGVSHAFAKTIYYGTEAEAVTVSFGTKTLVRFDQPVKTISQASRFNVTPADSNNPDYRLISIEPRTRRSQGSLTFLLANNEVVNLKIKTSTKKSLEGVNSFFDFVAKKSRLSPETMGASGNNISELELMKAMIRSDRVVGYKTNSQNRRIRTGIQGLKARLVKYYSSNKFNGYIFKVQNTSDHQKFAIDLKSLSLGKPNSALLSQTDEKILFPKGQGPSATYLRIVAKASSVYRTITLPVAPIKKRQCEQ